MQLPNQRQHIFQFRLGQPHAPLQRRQILSRQQLEVSAHHADGRSAPRRFRRQPFELQQEALGEVAGAHAGRVETLHQAQGRLDFADAKAEPRAQGAGEFLAGFGEHSVFVDAVDHHQRRQPQALGHGGEIELPKQIVAQRGACAVAFLESGVFVGTVVVRAAFARRVDVVPGNIDGEFLGNRRQFRFFALRFVIQFVRFVVRRIHRFAVGVRLPILLVLVLLQLQHGIAFHGLQDLLAQFQRGEPHQLDGLLHLRREGELLPKAHAQHLFHS